MDMKKVEEDIEYLLPVRFGEILCSGCRGDVENVSANQSPQRPYLLTDRHEKHNLMVEDLEYLLPVRFVEILCSGCRGDVENVSANQSPWQPYLFTDRPQKHKLGRGP